VCLLVADVLPGVEARGTEGFPAHAFLVLLDGDDRQQGADHR
jgi:hypothetical protein